MKTLATLLALLPILAQAAQVTFTASPDVTTYSMVVVDGKKLRTSLAAALAAYPGEECIAGLRTKDLVNFISPDQCTAAGCPTVPPPVPMTIRFTRPTVEFGFMFRASWEGVDVPFTSGFRIVANGVDLGTYPVAVLGVQYIGVMAPEGLQTLMIVPYQVDPTVVGPAVIHRVYTK